MRVALPNSSVAANGPLSSATATSSANTRPMYVLSELFRVAATNSAPTFSAETATRAWPKTRPRARTSAPR